MQLTKPHETYPINLLILQVTLEEDYTIDTEETAGMWLRFAGICKKLHEKVQQTWWRVRQ